ASGRAPGGPGRRLRPPRAVPARRPDERRPGSPPGLAPPGGDPRPGGRRRPRPPGRPGPPGRGRPGRLRPPRLPGRRTHAPRRRPGGRWAAVVDADLAGPRAVLRPAEPGERFRPLGLAGHKAVSDALAEAGVPAPDRAGHPVLADPDGRALWVLGYRIADRV